MRISLQNFQAQFYHVMRHNNVEADEMDNRAIGKAQNILGFNGKEWMESPLLPHESRCGGSPRGVSSSTLRKHEGV
jgi:hypothetical protein